ncbi:DUF3592 domain-containing protein [Marinibactrum halimedae]|uniref:DUF3592 domain-containing protein n=1 Tax=Marinibactrum halimedae TaxID=1444977 RepID=A0AA37T9H3_9GAMM|nr:DUF3592 domain-containing protein [Marinibactrum halimedae]MCD9460199.1 DUF3592 domain-containing protein [Marinibactrum halimedae]GLS27969.1 hypothetical protein GCM10007877_36880 [Marinibactrum halimedae]
MIAKVLGYSIGALFIVILLAPIPLSIWFIVDRISLLTSATPARAIIEECYRHRRSGTNAKVSWGPVAVTVEGLKVKGDFKWSKKKWCESTIGDEVTVLLHPTDKNKHRIHTFFQFWFLPLVMTLICIVFYPLSYRAKKRKDAEKKAVEESKE